MSNSSKWITGPDFRLLIGLYTTQWLGLAFVFLAVPVILRQNGTELDRIAAFMLIGLIWGLKFLWAPLVDLLGSNRPGHYLLWLQWTQPLLVFFVALAGFFEPTEALGKLTACLIAMAITGATQDIAADGHTINLLPQKQRGQGSAIQLAGSFTGTVLGGGVALVAYDHIGWTWTMWILALISLWPLFSLHRATKTPMLSRKATFRDIAAVLFDRNLWLWLIALCVARASFGPAHAVVAPLLVDKGWTITEIAILKSVAFGIAGLSGAIVAGVALNKFHRKTVLVVSLMASFAATVALYLFLPGPTGTFATYATLIAYQIPYGAVLTGLHTCIMDNSKPNTAGTDFSVQYCLSFLAGLTVAAGGLALAETHGYSFTIALGGALTLIALLLIPQVQLGRVLRASDRQTV